MGQKVDMTTIGSKKRLLTENKWHFSFVKCHFTCEKKRFTSEKNHFMTEKCRFSNENVYLCTQYGTELYLGGVFHHRFRHCAGEVGVPGRLRGLPSHDGLDVLIVEDRV